MLYLSRALSAILWGTENILYAQNTIIALVFLLVDERLIREFALVFVTEHKNAFVRMRFFPFRLMLLALISGLASSPVKQLIFSWFIGCKRGSTSTSLCNCFIRFTLMFLTLLCLIIINPPR